MEINKIDAKSYKIHTIKTNRYKTTRIEVIYRSKVDENSYKMAFVSELLSESSLKYPSRKDVAIALEDIYKPYYYAFATKTGNTLNNLFELSFINPEYIKEKGYLESVINFLYEMIYHPNVKNKEFDNNTFNLVKNNIMLAIDSTEENPDKKAINGALNAMDKTSNSAINTLGTKTQVEKLTASNIYPYYEKLINDTVLDIFIIGNTNMDDITKLIQKVFVKRKICTYDTDYYIENKKYKKVNKKEVKSSFLQTQLVYIFNLENLTKDEKEVIFNVYNYILGSGGLSSKLYRYIREENSYCYRISSMYFKYDNLLCIASSLDEENVNHSIKLINKAIKEMKQGDFSDKDVLDAKQNLLMSLNINKTSPSVILSNYEFKEFIGNYDMETKIELLNKVTKEDIIKVAKKVKENTIFIQKGDNNERN